MKFPKTGLGNMLLLWARAIVFARLNQFEFFTSPWWGFRWGALVRREQKKRLYWHYFRETPLSKRILVFLNIKFKRIVVEPKLEVLSENELNNKSLYLFNRVMTDYDLFGPLMAYNKIISDELYRALHPSKKKLLSTYETPVIGIHVRRGDFKMGSTLTPNLFFIEGIKTIRQICGQEFPVTVFTDASKGELADILSLPGIKIAEEKADILDILLLAKSKILFLSAGSSFGYWGAFLSDAFVIRPENDWLQSIKRNGSAKEGYFEMKWQFNSDNSNRILEQNFNSWRLKRTNEL